MPEIYDHALLADKKLATHVNDLLEAGTISDRQAYGLALDRFLRQALYSEAKKWLIRYGRLWDIHTLNVEAAGIAWMYIVLSEIEDCSSPETNVNTTHWKSDAPIDSGWYWYRSKSHRALMLRIDDHGLVNLPEEFDGRQAIELVGDWYMPQITPPY
jgi:hypothetical protein